MRRFLLIAVLCVFSAAAWAVDAPAGQVHIDQGKVLRGRFTEMRVTDRNAQPLQTAGHFTVAPASGLIWSMEQPFPTATIVTPNGAAQDLGGLAVKLPAKNLKHIYDMVGGALAGNWNDLASDFDITPIGNAGRWQMLMTPRQTGDKPRLPYARITVSGSRFVENIVMTKTDGTYDMFSFSDQTLGALPLTAQETRQLNEIVR